MSDPIAVTVIELEFGSGLFFVEGSSGNAYYVDAHEGHCNCLGANGRRHWCRHKEAVKVYLERRKERQAQCPLLAQKAKRLAVAA
jgi:hypothetical protein